MIMRLAILDQLRNPSFAWMTLVRRIGAGFSSEIPSGVLSRGPGEIAAYLVRQGLCGPEDADDAALDVVALDALTTRAQQIAAQIAATVESNPLTAAGLALELARIERVVTCEDMVCRDLLDEIAREVDDDWTRTVVENLAFALKTKGPDADEDRMAIERFLADLPVRREGESNEELKRRLLEWNAR